MFNQYLPELIRSNNRVIIPKVGAFILKKQDGDEVVTFNSILKFDDGLLSGVIAEKENLEKNEAIKKVAEYANQILEKINNGEQYKIEGLGNLYKDANGKVQFLDSKTAPKATAKTTAPKSSKSEPAKEKEASQKPAQATSKKEEPAATSKQKEAEKPKAPPATDNKETPKTDDKPKASGQSTKSKDSLPPKPPTQSPKKPTKEGNNSFLWVSIAVIAIAIGITVFLLFFNKPETQEDPLFTTEEMKADSTLAAEEEKILKEEKEIEDKKKDIKTNTPEKSDQKTSEEKSEQETQSTTNKTKKTTTSGKQYYIVAGVFQVEQNADNYAQKLQQEGYEDAQIFGIHKGMHAVCYDFSTNYNEALQKLKNIRKNREPNAWLLHY
ncbi:MAG: SPOR domain-containing protein [Bacteroidota bacterium]